MVPFNSLSLTVLFTALLIHASIVRTAEVGPGIIPTMPSSWPSVDQTIMISASLLQDPLITNAMEIVRQKVPAELLAILTSTGTGSTTKYRGDASANCYWPSNQCIRTVAGNGYASDSYTCSQPNTWAMTLDDGPTVSLVNGVHTYDTADIRNNLVKLNAKATFFVTGSNSYSRPEELQALVAAGQVIASHTWTHHSLTALTNEQVVAELMYTSAIIYRTTGLVVKYMRPPYGDVDDRVRAIANALGFHVALWNRDSLDASLTPSDATLTTGYNTVISWFQAPGPGFVSLEHDISTFTSAIAVRALQYAQSLGASFPYKIVPMATCDGIEPYANAPAVATVVATSTTSAKPVPEPTAISLDSSSKIDATTSVAVLTIKVGTATTTNVPKTTATSQSFRVVNGADQVYVFALCCSFWVLLYWH